MASGGETGYWPGFVDALSNMVMTLIIIIVLLNVALVFFFFKANKNTSQSVQTAVETTQKATAAEIEALQKENQHLKEELQQAIEKNEAVVAERNVAPSTKQGAASSDANKDMAAAKQADKDNKDQQQAKDKQVAALAADERKEAQDSAKAKQADKDNKDQQQARDAQAAPAQTTIDTKQIQASKAKELVVQGEAQSAPQPTETDVQGLVKEELLENSYNNKKGRSVEVNKNSVTTQGGNEVIIVYEDDNVEFSPSTLVALNKDLGGLISRNKNIKIEILVEIVENKGYSFSRRLAYYRASSIRNFALTKGADPGRIMTKLVPVVEGAQYSRAIIRVSQ